MSNKVHSSSRSQQSLFALLAVLTLFTAPPGAPAQTVWSNALYLDGVDDFVQAGNVPLANSSFTVELWARRHYVESMDFILGQGAAGTSVGLHFGFHYGSVFVFGFYYNDLFSAEAYTDDDWHHWAGTYDAGTKLRCLYRDGMLIASNTASANYQGSGPLVIGRAPCSAGSEFHGEVDEVRIWNVARSQAQIQANLSQPLTGLEANLMAYWKFDEATDTIAHDSTTNGWNGTLINGPVWTNSTIPTLLVTNLLDSGAGSLRQAIADATSGAMIILTNTGTLALTSGQLTITNSLNIVGSGAANLSISGNNSSRVFNVTNGVEVTIRNLTIRDGRAPNGGTGAAGASGGGIYNAGTLTLNDCVITNNRAGSGGAGYAGGTGASGGAGGAGGHGGGVYNGGAGTLQLDRCSISGNFSGTGGSGGNGGRGYDSTSTGGYGGDGGTGGTGGSGAGVYSAGSLVMMCSTLSANTDGSGGAGGRGGDGGDNTQIIHLHWGGNGGHGADGGAGGSGGALYAAGRTALSDSTISGNGSGEGGTGGTGGTGGHGSSQGYWGSGGDGGAGGVGGGIACGGPDISLERCTIVYNSAGSGGILGPHGSAASSSYTNGVNGAVGVGGGICSSNAPIQIVNTVLALNTRPVGTADDVYGAVASLGHNLVGNTSGSTGFGVTGDLLNTSPQLGSLANNGGPTLTHAPSVTSPVIDAGDNTGAPATDQRGFGRIIGYGIDIGAVESEYPPYALASLTLSAGTLSPAFQPHTTNYSALVGIAAPSITVTPVSQDPNATIQVGTNGGPYTPVASGTPSGSLPLAAGTNLIDVQVTASDGMRAWTYTIAVTRDIQTPILDNCPTNRTLAAGMTCQAPVPDLTGEVAAHDDLTATNGLIITQSPAAGSLLGLGANVVTMTVKDAASNTNTCDVTITVTDQTPPVITAPTHLVLAAEPGQCFAPLAVTAGASDNCDPAPVLTFTPPYGTPLPVGRTNVVLVATDAGDNTSTCTIDVMVFPGTNGPIGETWTARESTRYWTGVASSAEGTKLLAVMISGLYTSSDSGVSWTARDNSLVWAAVASSADGMKLLAGTTGTYGLLYTSTDAGTNWTMRSRTGNWTSLASSADGNKLVASGYNGYIYTSTDSGATWTGRLTDAQRNWFGVACSADGGKLAAVASGGQVYTSADAGATWVPRATTQPWHSVASSADGSKLVAVVYGGPIYTSADAGTNWIARASNQPWTSVASSADGSKLVAGASGGQIWTSADAGTNWAARTTTRSWQSVASSADGRKLVAVVSGGQIWTSSSLIPLTNAPTILATDLQAEATSPEGGFVTFTNVTATNICQLDLPVTCTPPSGSFFPLGPSTVTCFAQDALGTTNTATFTVTVRDTTPPVITCPPNVAVVAEPGQCEAAVTFDPPTATDLCDTNPVVTYPFVPGTTLPVGRSNVLCTATDASNNTSTCSFTVSVYPAITNQPTIFGATNQMVESTAPGTSATAYDATANHLDGTLVNGPSRVGSTLPFGGYALACDGWDDHVTVNGATPAMVNQYTLEVWVRPEWFNWLGGLISKYHTPSANGFTLRLSSYPPYSGINFDEMDTGYGILVTGQWQHVAAVNDNGTRRLYLNGVEQPLYGTPLSVTSNSDPVVLGADYLTFPRYFHGQMDEVRIWNLARTQAEIQAGMNQRLDGTEAGLVAYYRFDEAAAVTFSVTATNTCQPNVSVTCVPPSESEFSLGTNTVTCVAVDALGETSTSTFTVEVRDLRPPAIVTQPAGRTNYPGYSVTFCAAATGALPLDYQWRKDGTNLVDGDRIIGATGPCLTITNTVEEDSGEYAVSVANGYGSASSSNATLWVTDLSYFSWSTIGPLQTEGIDFPVTLTARNWGGNVDTHFAGAVSLSGSADSQTPYAILGSISGASGYTDNYFDGTEGYAFTPNTPLTVTHVRHYFGTKVSIWIDNGVTGTLIASQSVGGVPGTWNQTALTSPIQLSQGVRYRVGAYYRQYAPIYSQYPYPMPTNFPHGTIHQSYFVRGTGAAGDQYPNGSQNDLPYVDLRYTVPERQAVAVAPTQSGNFVNGVWNGTIAVSQIASNVLLVAKHSTGRQGTSSPFQVQSLLSGQLADALDTTNLIWTNGGWYSQTATTHDGVDAAGSSVSGDQTKWLQTTVTVPSCQYATLSFWWRASFSGPWGIPLRFYLDGVEQSYTSEDWSQQTYNLASGSHTLRWQLYYYFGGSGWVDEVVVTPVRVTFIGATNQFIEATGPTGANATYSVTATNACGQTLPVTFTPAVGSPLPFGTTNVICEAVYPSGVTNTTSFTVTVRDTTAPLLNCPTNPFAVAEAGQCEATVTFDLPTATDVCDPNPTITFPLGTNSIVLPVGRTNVFCTATDTNGNTSICSFTLSVYPAVTNQPAIFGATNQVVESTAAGTGTTTYDATANRFDGVLNGPERTGSTLSFGGYALSFDGLDDYVSLPGGVNLSNSSFTIESWVRHDNNFGFILAQGTNSQDPGLLFGFDYSYFLLRFTQSDYLYTEAAYTDADWHHWAGTFDAATGLRCVYRDGTLVASDTASANYTGTGPLFIGNWFADSYSYPFEGTIDEVRIWNVARNEAEIQAGMNQRLAGTESGLVAYYRFDEAAGVFSVTATNTCQPDVPVTFRPSSGNIPLGMNTVVCVAADAVGETNTATFTVEVRDVRPPAIVTQPAGRLVGPGTNVVLCVAATGGAPIAYQWRKDGMDLVDGERIAGAVSSCLTISDLVEGDSGEYSVVLTNAYGGTNSADAPLWVTDLDHFAWDPITSPQTKGAPFRVTVTAQDEFNNTDTHFTGTVRLAGSAEAGRSTNCILGDPSSNLGGGYGIGCTFGYAFIPNTNLTVTHVRYYGYLGGKVSIWTDTGALLAAQNVAGTAWPGWMETPLARPLELANGVRYRLALYATEASSRLEGMSGDFPHGIIDEGYWDVGDVFPATATATRWWFVDLRYTVGGDVPVSPGNSLNFTNGLWSGDITVLQPATNMVLVATHSAGFRGVSNPFDVLLKPPPPVFAGWAIAGPGQLRLQAAGTAGFTYTLQTSTNLVDWVDHTNLVADPTELIECLEAVDTNAPAWFYRLSWP